MKKRLIDLGGQAALVDLALSSVTERPPSWALHGKVLRDLRSARICRCRPEATVRERRLPGSAAGSRARAVWRVENILHLCAADEVGMQTQSLAQVCRCFGLAGYLTRWSSRTYELPSLSRP
jgi:hypothetical protein